MKWTDKLPTKPGFYWIRDWPFDRPNIVEVKANADGTFYVEAGGKPSGRFGTTWQDEMNDWSDEPIAMPEEVENVSSD